LIAIEISDELADPAVVLEYVVPVLALIGELDSDTGVQERQLPQPLCEHVVVEFDVREDLGARLEADDRAAPVGRARLGERRLRHAQAVFLLIELAVTMDRQL